MLSHIRSSGTEVSAQRLGYVVLVGIALCLTLVGGRVLLYTPLLAQPGALVYVLEPIVLLLVYAGLVLGFTRSAGHNHWVALRTGTVLGLLTGTLWIGNLTLETFADVSGPLSLLTTAPFLLGGFALWGVAAFRGAWQTGAVRLGVLAALWSAMLCVLLTVTFGWLLTYMALPRLEQIVTTDPDFLRSHWSNLQAFAIANSLDSGFSHLLGALLIGGVVGSVGSLLGLQAHRWLRRSTAP